MACAVAMMISVQPLSSHQARDQVVYAPWTYSLLRPQREVDLRRYDNGSPVQRRFGDSDAALYFNIGKIAGRQIHFIPDFVAGFLFLVSCRFESLSKRRKIIFFDWSFCHIDSPYYILLFTSLSEYVYTVPIHSLYNSFLFTIEALKYPFNNI